jgi:hypothetical protein
VNENAGTADFTVSLSSSSANTVTASYSTADGTATAVDNEDYSAQTAQTVSFDPGQTSKQISVPITDDAVTELTEQFTITLSSPTNASIADDTATGTILDNDPPTVSVEDASTAEGNANSHPMKFLVSLSSPTSATVTVNFATQSLSAKFSDHDYQPVTGTLAFSPGQTSKTIPVTVFGDTKVEPDETFKLNLSGATNGVLGSSSSALGTILNEDHDVTPPTVALTNVPTQITRKALINRGIQFTETPNERSRFANDLLMSRRGLGLGSSTKFNIVVASRNFPLGRARSVILKPDKADIGTKNRFKVKIRVVATDAAGNHALPVTRTVQVTG